MISLLCFLNFLKLIEISFLFFFITSLNIFLKYSSRVALLEAKLLIDLMICSYSIPLFSRGFFNFLILVLKYFKFLFDGSLKYFPKKTLEIFIKNFFLYPTKVYKDLIYYLFCLWDSWKINLSIRFLLKV